MKAFQASKIIIALACAGLTACEEKAPKPKGPSATTLLKQQLEESRSRVASLEKQLNAVVEARRAAEQQLQDNQEKPSLVLRYRLNGGIAESTATLGWLKAAKKIAAANAADLGAGTDLDVARHRAQECIDQQRAIGELYHFVNEQGSTDRAEMDPITLQNELLLRNSEELQQLLNSTP
jgi:hypothetical protein